MKNSNLTNERRQALWVALSTLWLDSQLQDYDYAHIARVIFESCVSLEQAMVIHKYEVAPAVGLNLASVAGEWAFFDQKWLVSRCQTFRGRRHHWLHRFRCLNSTPYVNYFTRDCWLEITKHYIKLQSKVGNEL